MTSVSTMAQSRIMRPTHRPLNMASVASTNNSSWFTLPSYMAGFLHELGPASGVYTFISKNSSLNKGNGNTTNNNSNSTYNLMSDRRVIRGNTYAGNIRVSPVASKNGDARFKRDGDKRRSNNRRKMLPTLPNSRPASKHSLNIDSSLMGSQEERLRSEDLARARVRRRLADNEQRKRESHSKLNDDNSKNKPMPKSVGIQVDLQPLSSNQSEPKNDHDNRQMVSNNVDDLDEVERSLMVSLLVANSKADALLELINEMTLQ